MTIANDRTQTPQEAFAHVGNLENQEAIALISKQMLGHTQSGLWAVAVDDDDRALLGKFEAKLADYEGTTRAEWAELKEQCLLLLGSPVASVVDHLISALRTPAIAESAIRSAGWQLIQANEAKARLNAQGFMRKIMSNVIGTEK
jgi:hypothetical protein